MGGFGSGRWRGRREVVEDCYSVSADELEFVTEHAGTVCLPVRKHREDVVGKLTCNIVRINPETFALTFRLLHGDRFITHFIPLGETPARTGGRRMAFLCPIEAGDGYCGKACRTLYAPPSSSFLGCRGCHKLSYASSQRRAERLKRADQIADDVIEEADEFFERLENGDDISVDEMFRLRKRLSYAGFDLWEQQSMGENGCEDFPHRTPGPKELRRTLGQAGFHEGQEGS